VDVPGTGGDGDRPPVVAVPVVCIPCSELSEDSENLKSVDCCRLCVANDVSELDGADDVLVTDGNTDWKGKEAGAVVDVGEMDIDWPGVAVLAAVG